MDNESQISEVIKYENTSYYLLILVPFIVVYLTFKNVGFLKTDNYEELFWQLVSWFSLFIFLSLYSFFYWKMIIKVTRKRSKVFYYILVVLNLLSVITIFKGAVDSIETIGSTWWFIFNITNIYTLYLLLSSKFRDYIYKRN
jgi:hypothetical protein